jgi:membrane protease YdiL (CAAX protease family)
MDDSAGTQPEQEAWTQTGDIGPIPTARPVAAAATAHPRPPNDLLIRDSSIGQAWADIVVAAVLILVASVAVESALWSAATQPIGDNVKVLDGGAATLVQRTVLIPMLMTRAGVSLLVIGLITRRRGQRPASLGLTTTGLGVDVLFGFFAAGAAFLLFVMLYLVLSLIWPAFIDQMTENATRLMTLIPRFHPLVFLPVAIVIALYEEVLFRGFLMTRLRRGTGSWTLAVILSTAVFTLLHAGDQTKAALVAVTALSLVFAVVTILRRSLLPAIVAHTVWNLSQFALLYYTVGDVWK